MKLFRGVKKPICAIILFFLLFQIHPFAAAQPTIFETEKRHAFNEMILHLPSFIRKTGVVISEGTNTIDGTHFNSESAIIMGKRYAQEMKKIQLELKKKK